MSLTHSIINRARRIRVLRRIWYGSKSILDIEFFYVHREGASNLRDSNPTPLLDRLDVRRIDPSLIQTIAANPENHLSEETIRKRLSEGCLGFCILHEGEVAASMWADLKKLDYRCLSLPLKKHEAYLFNAVTVPAYRGRNLAPYLRLEFYKRLERMGRNRFCSVTGFFNIEALRFKKKLGARPAMLFLSVILFGKHPYIVLLKKF